MAEGAAIASAIIGAASAGSSRKSQLKSNKRGRKARTQQAELTREQESIELRADRQLGSLEQQRLKRRGQLFQAGTPAGLVGSPLGLSGSAGGKKLLGE